MTPMHNSTDSLTRSHKRSWNFWMSFLSVNLSLFASALELTSVSTALPTIVEDLHGSQFVWVGSAYTLCATAFVPLTGGLAQVFGRRAIMLASLFLFALGSTLCGVASNMNFLISGRAVQGLGSGGIASLTTIIVSDLVPLHERGVYNGILGLTWGVAASIGPVAGGSLVQHGQWRWLFYLNIPVCGVAAVLVSVFLKLRIPQGTLHEKLRCMDWLGNCIVIASTTAVVIALSWGGIQFSWKTANVLVPLIFGLIGLAGFIVYEAKIPRYPIVPFSLMATLTGLSGYLQGFLTPVVMLGVVFYLPVYFQACLGASPTASGVDIFGTAYSVVPFSIISGISVVKSNHYRPQMWMAWVLILIGTGLLSTLQVDSSHASMIGFQIVIGAGIGILTTAVFYPILAPLPVSSNARACAFYTFLRNFGQIWAVTIGGSILQNELHKRLPVEFAATFQGGTEIAYEVIPRISGLEEPLKQQVRVAFAESVRAIWQVLIGVGVLGLFASLFMKHLPLHTSLDQDWGLIDPEREMDVESTSQGSDISMTSTRKSS